MDSYEIVKRAIEFKKPERIPLDFSLSGFTDFFYVHCVLPKGWDSPGLDEWGCGWERSIETNCGQVRSHPIKSWEDFKDYEFPNPNASGRFDSALEDIKKAGNKYVLGTSTYTLFERMHFLRGMSELLMDLYINPNMVHELAERVLDFQIGIVENYAKFLGGKVHGIQMTDDWGTQQGPIISLSLWRKFFKPYYKKLCDAIHNCGMHAHIHSCGKINDLLEDFIEAGFDVINLQQPRLLGIEEVGRKFRGKVCFSSNVDIQMTLPYGSRDEIRAEIKLLLENWGTSCGGFIARQYDNLKAIGVSEENHRVMFDTFKELGKKSIKDN